MVTWRFLHGFEQGALHLGRRAVDFVGQHEVGEDGPLLHLEHRLVLVVNHGAHQVGGQQVGRELHALEVQVQHLGQRGDGERFGQARHAFEQDVPAREQADEQAAEQLLLAHHHLAHLGKYLADEGMVVDGAAGGSETGSIRRGESKQSSGRKVASSPLARRGQTGHRACTGAAPSRARRLIGGSRPGPRHCLLACSESVGFCVKTCAKVRT